MHYRIYNWRGIFLIFFFSIVLVILILYQPESFILMADGSASGGGFTRFSSGPNGPAGPEDTSSFWYSRLFKF